MLHLLSYHCLPVYSISIIRFICNSLLFDIFFSRFRRSILYVFYFFACFLSVFASFLYCLFIFPFNIYFCFPSQNVCYLGARFLRSWRKCNSRPDYDVGWSRLCSKYSARYWAAASVVEVHPVKLSQYRYEEVWVCIEQIADLVFPLGNIQRSHAKELVTSMCALGFDYRNVIITAM